MSEIDIRNEMAGEIRCIRFSNERMHNGDYSVCKVEKYGDSYQFVDDDGDGTGHFRLEDIDNMIKALEKAKELWG